MKTLLLFLFPLLFGWAAFPANRVHHPVTQASEADVRAEILGYTNAARKANGLKPLVINDDLNNIAQQHSERMAAKKVSFGHTGFQKRYDAARKLLPGLTACGENVAFGPDSSREIVDGWMKSAGHRANILGNFTLIGIGVAKGKDGSWYYTQFFCGQ